MFDLNKFYGENQPAWNPNDLSEFSASEPILTHKNNIIRALNFFNSVECRSLIEQFERQQTYPVGVSGYSDTTEDIGSYRANAWAPELAKIVTDRLSFLPRQLVGDGDNLNSANHKIPCRFDTSETTYEFLGSTPWMRFMKYNAGGKHVPHYDASFVNKEEQYVSLFSWVLYLNDLDKNDGGRFQFVDDGYDIPPRYRPEEAFADWVDMAPKDKITVSVRPMEGAMLLFPHWLCHQVEDFTGDIRYIVRGDIAYGIK